MEAKVLNDTDQFWEAVRSLIEILERVQIEFSALYDRCIVGEEGGG